MNIIICFVCFLDWFVFDKSFLSQELLGHLIAYFLIGFVYGVYLLIARIRRVRQILFLCKYGKQTEGILHIKKISNGVTDFKVEYFYGERKGEASSMCRIEYSNKESEKNEEPFFILYNEKKQKQSVLINTLPNCVKVHFDLLAKNSQKIVKAE